MKIDLYQCDRCYEDIRIEDGKNPITVEHLDGRFSNEEKETLHLCDDCYVTFLYAMDTKKERREPFNKLAEKFYKQDQKEEEA